MNMKNELLQPKFDADIYEFIRNTERSKRLGILRAFMVDAKLYIGYSACNWKAGDVFDRETGLRIARNTAFRKSLAANDDTEVPSFVREKIPKFIERCQKYFKNEPIPEWAIEVANEVEELAAKKAAKCEE